MPIICRRLSFIKTCLIECRIQVFILVAFEEVWFCSLASEISHNGAYKYLIQAFSWPPNMKSPPVLLSTGVNMANPEKDPSRHPTELKVLLNENEFSLSLI